VALEILEHTDDPYTAFAKLISLSRKRFIVSLPNCYSLTLKWNFVFHNRINGKYDFPIRMPADRHRWVMNCPQIRAFYDAQARQHGCTVETREVMLRLKPMKQYIGRLFPREWMISSIIGVFTKQFANESETRSLT
jgi:hypothetical protein